MPEVEVIQTQPKPVEVPAETPPQVAKKKPAPVEPPPAVAVAKPKPKPVPDKADPVGQTPPQQAQSQPQPVQPVAQPVAAPLSTEVKMSPVGGSEIPISKVSGSVSHISVEDIKRTGAVDAQSLLQTSVPGIIVTDLQGNGFQTEGSG